MRNDIELTWCDYCPHKFVSSGAFKDHMRLEHPDRPLKELVYRKKGNEQNG